jgi:hypothetical protein
MVRNHRRFRCLPKFPWNLSLCFSLLLLRFREDVLVLALAHNEGALVVAFAFHKLKAACPRIDGHEGDCAVVVFPRSHRAAPFAEIEDSGLSLAANRKLTQIWTRVTSSQFVGILLIGGHNQPLAKLGSNRFIVLRGLREILNCLRLSIE